MSRVAVSFAILALAGGMAMAVCPGRKPHQTPLPTFGWQRNYLPPNSTPTPLHTRYIPVRMPCSLRTTPTPSNDTLNYFSRPTFIQHSVGSYAGRPSTIRRPSGPYGTSSDAYPDLDAGGTRTVSEILADLPLASGRRAPFSGTNVYGILGLRVTADRAMFRSPEKLEPRRLMLRRSYRE